MPQMASSVRPPAAPPVGVERKAYTVSEFCIAFRISKAQYYELKRSHKGPDETHLGGRVIITVEAAERWVEEREAETRENPRKHLRRKPLQSRPRAHR